MIDPSLPPPPAPRSRRGRRPCRVPGSSPPPAGLQGPPSRPPPPTVPLDRLFARLRAESEAVEVDPRLARRVERRILAREAADPLRVHVIPGWAAVLAVVILVLGAGSTRFGQQRAGTGAEPPPHAAPAEPKAAPRPPGSPASARDAPVATAEAAARREGSP